MIPVLSPVVSASSLLASLTLSVLVRSAGFFPLIKVLSLLKYFIVTCCSTSDFFFQQPLGLLWQHWCLNQQHSFPALQPTASLTVGFVGHMGLCFHAHSPLVCVLLCCFLPQWMCLPCLLMSSPSNSFIPQKCRQASPKKEELHCRLFPCVFIFC